MWIYESKIGTLYICLNNRGRYGFVYDGIEYTDCKYPELTADDVYMKQTGCNKWDLSPDDPDFPSSLSGWTKIK